MAWLVLSLTSAWPCPWRAGRSHVGLHGHPGVEGEALEDDGDAVQQALVGLAVVEHLALGGRDEPGEDAHDGGLAAAGRTDEADELVGLDGQVDVLQDAQGLPVPRSKDFWIPLSSRMVVSAFAVFTSMMASLVQGVAGEGQLVAALPDQAVEGDHDGRHEQAAGGQQGQVPVVGRLADGGAQAEGAQGGAVEVVVLGDDAGVPGAAGGGDPPVTGTGSWRAGRAP